MSPACLAGSPCSASPAPPSGRHAADRTRAAGKPAALPARGMSMAQVEARFGAPSERLDPRGGQKRQWPTINRWIYPAFTVYFEKQQGHRRGRHKADAERDRPEAADPLTAPKHPMTEPAAFPRRMGTPVRGPDRLAARRHRLGRAPGRSRGDLHRAGRGDHALPARWWSAWPTTMSRPTRDARLRSDRVDMDRVRFVDVRLRRHLAARLRPDHRCATATASACSISASPAGAASSRPSRDDRLVERLDEQAAVPQQSTRKRLISHWKAAPSRPMAPAPC